MPLNGPRAEEEPRADLRIRQAVAGEPRDLPLLCGQIIAGLDGPLPHRLARRLELLAGALGERLHPDLDEHFVGRAQLLSRVDPAILTAQPLAVDQMRAGELGTEPGAAQPLDRLVIQSLGGRRRRSTAPGSAPRCRARTRCRRAVSSAASRSSAIACELGVASAHGRLDQLWERERGYPRLEGIRDGSPGRRCRLLVAGEAVVQDRRRPVRVGRSDPLTLGWLARSFSRSSAEASASLPCSARSLIKVKGGNAVPVAAATLSASAISEATAGQVACPRS